MRAGTIVLALAIPLAGAGAQEATVIVNHAPGRSVTFTHRRADDLISHERSGLPRELEVPDNGRLCFAIRGANPVLYRYTAGATTIQDQSAQKFADLVAVLRPLAGVGDAGNKALQFKTMGVIGISPPPTATPADSFATAVGELYGQFERIVRLRRKSDSIPDFRVSADSVRLSAEAAREYSSQADVIWERNSATPAFRQSYMRLLREQQKLLLKSAQGVQAEFATGVASLDQPVCVDGTANPQRAVLSIRYVGPDSAYRRTGDSVAAVSSRPVSTVDFETGAGLSLFAHPRGQRIIRTDAAGNLESVDDDDTPVRPMLYLMGRARQVPWLWAAVGFTADKSGLSNLSFGPVLRTGIFGHGPHLTIGAGYGLTRVPVGVRDGAVIGQPIPAGKELDAIVDRKLRGSFTAMLLISGLD